MVTKILGIKFAPIRIPIERRLQTLCVFYACSEIVISFIFSTLLLFLLFTPLWFLTIAYCGWLYYDYNQQDRGGRYIEWFRHLKLWKYFSGYFPITLEKTEDIAPNRNYIFGFHPHGIIPMGPFAHFASEATGFSKLFPGIRPRLITLNMNFNMPIHREIMLCRGICSANRESIEYLLKNERKGTAVVLVVGGALEALDAIPNTMKLTLKNRKGFIRLAIKHGAWLVPVISFGENEIFHQIEGNSFFHKLQIKFTKMFYFSPILFHGRGIFNYNYGMLPFRKPIHTIIGAPLEVVKCENPTKEQIDEMHTKYCNALKDLFDKHKGKYSSDPNLEMIFI